MRVTKKNQYALIAVLELAKNRGNETKKISEIARAQAIPFSFLEVILCQLKRSGLIKSKRGYKGGYRLARDPKKITVGDIIRYLNDTSHELKFAGLVSEDSFPSQYAVMPMWNKVIESIFKIYDTTTIQDLLDNEY